MSDLEIKHVAKEEVFPVFDGTRDNGYNKFNYNWWTNPSCPYAFKYMSLDALYPHAYFELSDHPNDETASELYHYMQEVYQKLFKRKFTSVLELGSGGGAISKQ